MMLLYEWRLIKGVTVLQGWGHRNLYALGLSHKLRELLRSGYDDNIFLLNDWGYCLTDFFLNLI